MSMMSAPKLPGTKRSRYDVGASEANPLAVATSAADRQVLDMVADALAAKRLRLAFQPAVYAGSPEIPAFYEGFIRILDDMGRVIPARDFMEVSETRELGREIDCAALQTGLLALQRNPGIRIAINMSARSIGYRKWTSTLRTALRENPGIGKGLILEISEASAVLAPDVVIPFMKELKAEGILFCLDDFGDGFSSLSLLQDFSFDLAKIDGRFIRGVDANASQQAVVRAAVAISREFNMFPIAESVETVAEASFLRAAGLGALQGYLFGAPTVSPDFTAFHAARRG